MKNRGFTLAEMLITLGIIGVIATLTMPALNFNIQKQQAGPAFTKAVNILTNANRLALEENDARFLSSVSDNYTDILKKYVVGHSDGDNLYISNDGLYFSSNDFSTYPVVITVDINGSKNPNIIGKDRFLVYVYKNGGVAPYGGLEYAKYEESSDVLWKNGCNGDNVTEPSTCSGAIADNGWTVKYDFARVQ